MNGVEGQKVRYIANNKENFDERPSSLQECGKNDDMSCQEVIKFDVTANVNVERWR